MRPVPERLGRSLVSALIVTVLGLQTIAALGVTLGPLHASPFMWPFLSYPMYSAPHFEGDSIPRYRVVATTTDGTQIEVTPKTLGTNFWIHRNAFLKPLLNPDRRDDLVPGIELVERRHGVRLVEVRLEDRPLVLTGNGVLEAELQLRGIARRAAIDEPWQVEAW